MIAGANNDMDDPSRTAVRPRISADHEAKHHLVTFARALDLLRIPYFVGGSFAARLLGSSRVPRDIDLITRPFSGREEELCCLLVGWEICCQDLQEANIELRSACAFHDDGTHVDLFVRSGPWIDGEFERATIIETDGYPILVQSLADQIRNKTRWLRRDAKHLDDLDDLVWLSQKPSASARS